MTRADGAGRRQSRREHDRAGHGRPGYAAWGVSVGGSFDRSSAELANALLGNSAGCAVLEMTLVGGIYQADGSLALALAGAPIEATVITPDGSGRSLRPPLSFTLRDGERLVARSDALRRPSLSGRTRRLAHRTGFREPIGRTNDQGRPAPARRLRDRSDPPPERAPVAGAGDERVADCARS